MCEHESIIQTNENSNIVADQTRMADFVDLMKYYCLERAIVSPNLALDFITQYSNGKNPFRIRSCLIAFFSEIKSKGLGPLYISNDFAISKQVNTLWNEIYHTNF